MNYFKKALLVGLLMPGLAGAATATSALQEAAKSLRTTGEVMGTIEGISRDLSLGLTNQPWFNDFKRYGVTPALSLGLLLEDLPRIQKELEKVLAAVKQMPVLARCARQPKAKLQDAASAVGKACQPLGCTSSRTCTKVGLANLTSMLTVLKAEFFGPNGLFARIFDLVQQPGLKADIAAKVADPLDKVINVLNQIQALIPA